MRGYEDFAGRLRREIREADLGRAEVRFNGLAEQRRRSSGAPMRVAAAAALLIAAGIGGRAAYGSWDTRRMLSDENRKFIDALFARGLLEVEAEDPPVDRLFDWTADSEGSQGSQTVD